MNVLVRWAAPAAVAGLLLGPPASGAVPIPEGPDAASLPVYSGGLLAELLYSDEPHAIDNLELDPDDPAGEYLAGQQSLLAIPQFDQGAGTAEREHDRPCSTAGMDTCRMRIIARKR